MSDEARSTTLDPVPEAVGPADSPSRSVRNPENNPPIETPNDPPGPNTNGPPDQTGPPDQDANQGPAPQDDPSQQSYFRRFYNYMTPQRTTGPARASSTGNPTALRFNQPQPAAYGNRNYNAFSAPSTQPPPPLNGPKMGGWKWLGSYYEPWTGGAPNQLWTRLENPIRESNNPNFLRGSGPKSTSQYNHRREGLYKDDPTRRFKETGDLDDFCKQLKHAFNNNGLNTIAYRNDPTETCLQQQRSKHHRLPQ